MEFIQNNIPKIYAYRDEAYRGCLKIGYTTKKNAEERVREQYPIKTPHQTWEIVLEETAVREDESFFTDHNIHRQLKERGIRNIGGEWFECDVDVVRECIIAERRGIKNHENRHADFPMRPEQCEAVQKTASYFRTIQKEGYIPHFLWNAKMRFGKTFASYQLAKEMGWKKVLILTFKPAVQSAWRDDLLSHIDFEGWQFLSNKEGDLKYEDLDREKPFVFFASFQDILGVDKKSEIIKPKSKNEWLHKERWDCIIFDEYHYGAWKDKARSTTGIDSDAEIENESYLKNEEAQYNSDAINDNEDGASTLETLMPLQTQHYLYLSGTPFRAINTGEFLEDAIYSWTYIDEQKAKENWDYSQGKNPYKSLSQMIMLTYELPDEIRKIALKGDFDEFDLNEFFKATGEGKSARFKHEEDVQKWLFYLRGQYNIEKLLQQGNQKPPMPFSDVNLLHSLQHTFWYLPSVASCDAMENLLLQSQNKFFHQNYEIIVCAGKKAGIGEEAYRLVKEKMGNPLEKRTITLSCGKLTTGVSVPPWSGILVLRSIESPESYFQAIFRVQTPWVLKNPSGTSPQTEEIVKEQCFVFDFAPYRAFKQVVAYSRELGIGSNLSDEEKVKECLKFLPILGYLEGQLQSVDVSSIMNYAYAGITSTLLAKRWKDAKLVKVDNLTLQRLLNNPKALEIIKNIEAFRSLNTQKIQDLVTKSEEIKKVKKEKALTGEEFSEKEKKQLTQEEKDRKTERRKIQEALLQLVSRIPNFMYLSEYREKDFEDVMKHIEAQERELFMKVTGISIDDFWVLAKEIDLFNKDKMDSAVKGFAHCEERSFSY